MVKRSKSMERTIREGNDYLKRMEQRENQRTRNNNRQQKQEKKVIVKKVKQQRQLKRKLAAPVQRKPPVQRQAPVQKQAPEPKQVVVQKKVLEQKAPEQKKVTKNLDQLKISANSSKIEKKTPILSKPEKQTKQVEILNTDKPIQQPKQGPRKTKSNVSDVSDANKPSVGMVDCVFVVDTTGSMDPYLERTTHTVEMLVERIKCQSKNQQVSVRFGLVCYRDHPPQEQTYVTEVHDLCSHHEILEAISKADCYGGGDGAEAALDGLNDATQKITWRDSSKIPSLRYIFHICDQPPHGKEFGGYSELWDEGCPCGLKPDQVIHRINMRQIHYRLIKANSTRLEQFANLFKTQIVNYDEVTLEDGIAEGMEIKISDMVIRELCPDVLYD